MLTTIGRTIYDKSRFHLLKISQNDSTAINFGYQLGKQQMKDYYAFLEPALYDRKTTYPISKARLPLIKDQF